MEAARQRQEALIREFEERRAARSVVVPTNVEEVKKELRRRNAVVTYFGEDAAGRRDRLRRLVAGGSHPPQKEGKDVGAIEEVEEEVVGVGEEQKEVFYTEGTANLRRMRLKVGRWSLSRARERVGRGQLDAALVTRMGAGEEEARKEMEERHRVSVGELKRLRRMEMEGSELGDERPLSSCHASSCGRFIATAGWSGLCKIWDVREGGEGGGGGGLGGGFRMQHMRTFRAHDERITGVAWHPSATMDGAGGGGGEGAASTAALMTASADGKAKIWNSEGGLLTTLEGHVDRLGRCAFHPMGHYCATTSFDATWRLWDVESGEELLLQEGHSRPVYAVAFHPDGSLVVTAGLDALGRVWDVRTGKCVMLLKGHVKQILAADVSPNGVHVATGSDDHAVRFWDLRQAGKSLYVLPAHSSLVSQVRFDRNVGRILLTSSFDTTARLWSTILCKPIVKLAGHEGKVMCADSFGGEGGGEGIRGVVTVSYDRTVKLWASTAVVGNGNENGHIDGDVPMNDIL